MAARGELIFLLNRNNNKKKAAIITLTNVRCEIDLDFIQGSGSFNACLTDFCRALTRSDIDWRFGVKGNWVLSHC